MRVLITGAAGFIGFHTAKALLDRGHAVAGVDNLNPYYDPALKKARLAILKKHPAFRFVKLNLADRSRTAELFDGAFSASRKLSTGNGKRATGNGPRTQASTAYSSRLPAHRSQCAASPFDVVIHLAAQAGVRYSLENPHAYVDANLTAFVNVLEGCRHSGVKHLVYASSSSVYGGNAKLPFSETDRVDNPVSLYAATKKADELMAHTYSHLFGLPTTGLRFFTVYGPWGRPDMAMWKFTEAILAGKPIDVYNRGEMWRDFTYIDDIVEGVVRVAEDTLPWGVGSGVRGVSRKDAKRNTPNAIGPGTAYRIYNIGNNRPEKLTELISVLEKALGKKARKRLLPLQPGDVPKTYADIAALEREYGFKPSTTLKEGVEYFVEWYLGYRSGGRSGQLELQGPGQF